MLKFLEGKFIIWIFLGVLITVPADAQKQDDNSQQPTIVTKDGSIIFQSALNGNISFSLNGDNADVTLGDTSFKELIETVQTQKAQIEALKNEGGPCSKSNPCGKNGVCINVNKQVSQDLYKCICQAGYTGATCEQMDPCLGVFCMNTGQCQNVAGRGVCVCTGNWFGPTCSIPKPTECKYKVMEKSRFIASPGYPNAYPSNADCTWEITTTPGSIVKLVFMDTNVGSSSKCTSDYLQVSDGVSQTVLGTLCGMIASQTLYSSSNKMILKLKTGNTPIGIGFNVFYSEEINDKCGGRLTAPQGSIRSTDDNSNLLPCIWVIDTNSKERLTLKFDKVIITNPSGKCDSYLEVRSGDSNDSPLFEKVCSSSSSSAPYIMKTQSPKLFIKFVRKDKTNGDMISGTYDTECGGVIDVNIGDKINFTSPFYPQNYPSKKRCQWVFHAPPQYFLNVRFLDFVMEEHKTCDNDKLTVRTGDSVSTYCGGRLPVPATSQTNRLDIEFQTDGDMHFRGFKAEIMAVDGKCTRTITGTSGTVSSPFYPSYYPDNTDCVYTLVANNEDSVIELRFTLFNIESDADCSKDYLQIYDGDSVNSPIRYNDVGKEGRLCGTKIPTITISSGQTLTAKFHSDAKTNNAGFMADWTAVAKPVNCNVRKSDSTGIIQSPFYPSRYSNNRNCNTTIAVPNGHVIKLDFTIFNLESSIDCDKDYVKVYDGRDAGAELIGTYCGNESPRILVSSGNFLFVNFHADHTEVGNGFYAKYTTGTDLCGGTLQDPSGFIRSPGYPIAYPPNRECSWIVKADVGNAVSLTVSTLELEESLNCTKDYVKIYDGDNAGGELLATLCGTITLKSFHSKSRYLYIQFKSDSTTQWKGFLFQYQPGCTFYITDRKGTIASPGYPDQYPPNTRCRWVFSGYQSDNITITSKDFQLDDGTDCLDYVQFTTSVTNGSSPKYCGKQENVTFVGQQNVQMHLITDESISERGFRMDYVFEGCSQDFTAETGMFTTPNYPNNYLGNDYCVWRIRVPEMKRVQLTFEDFDIEDERDFDTKLCGKDFVSVFNGNDTLAPMLGTYCSKKATFHLTSTGNEMTVWFNSSLFENRKGFKATYKTLDGGCSGTYTGTHGTLYSPNYPNEYPTHSSCQWSVSTNSSQRINLTISNFHLEDSYSADCRDYLEVTDDKTFKQLGKYCGRVNTTTLTSDGSSVTIKFFSDAQNSGKGFKIDYKTVCGGVINVGDSPGYLTSPHYPYYYEKSECEWLLTAQPGKQIQLQFVDFGVEECHVCYCDSLTIRDGASNNSTSLGKFCGNNIPSNEISTGNNLHLKFEADFYQHQHGFKIMYTTDLSTCGGYLKSISGNVISPLYPKKSPENADCIWTIEVTQGNIVELSFDILKLGPVCDSSYIKIFEGNSTSGSLIKRLCSGNTFESFKSTSNVLTLQFYTRVATVGFAATYRTSCTDRLLTASSGVIESPGYPNFYENNLDCKWRLNVPVGKTAIIEIEEFDVEPIPDSFSTCLDYFTLYDGEVNEEVTSRYCSHTIPNTLKSSSATTVIRFVTDGIVSRHGFRLKYKIGDRIPDCGANLAATTTPQYFTSKNYPLSYPENYFCEWTINTDVPGMSIELQFYDFRTEDDSECSYDYVTVETDSKMLPQTFCGNSTRSTPFISTGNSITVTFNSDHAYQYKGFNASYQTVCAQTLTDTKGIVKSHQEPNGMHQSNISCTWKIMQELGSIIMVFFKKFKLQSSTNCAKDYVIVRNGVANDSVVLGRFCGSNVPSNITSTNHEITITFVTDGEINDSGFELEYERMSTTCGGRLQVSEPGLSYELKSPGYPKFLPPNLECEWTLSAPEGSVIELELNDVNFTAPTTDCSSTNLEMRYHDSKIVNTACGTAPLSRKKFRVASSLLTLKLKTGLTNNVPPGFSLTWKIACGRHFVRTNGSFTSRNYPGSYPVGEDCMYTVELLDQSKQVQLHFPKFELQNGGKDFIKVYDSLDTSNLIGTYSGSTVPTSIVSSSYVMTVQFVSDNSSTTAELGGFMAEYSTVGFDCGGSLDGKGVLSTPYYPSNYPIGRRCKWKLHSILLAVELNITDFDIAHSVNCTEDYLLIRNGEFDDSPVLGKYCGQNKPPVLYSTGFYMTVEFVSNRDNYRGTGFRAQFQSHHPACGGEITGDSGIITSPDYPKNYQDSMECIWRITANDKHNIIQMQFHDLDIEFHESCNYDYLEIRGGSTSKSPLINKLCGEYNKTALGVIATTGPDVYLKFEADVESNAKGFNMTWNAKKPQCGGKVSGTGGEIKSPGYPNSYTAGGHTDCFWIGDMPPGHEVILTVTDFQIPASTNCSTDRVLIQNGKDPMSPVIGRLCGTINEPMVFNSSGSHFRIHMISDKNGHTTSSMYKFKITYTLKEIGCGGMISANEGIITSPGFPNSYSHNLECEWVVTTDPGTKVLVTVETLDINDTCTYDFLELRDGSDVNAPQMVKLCGKNVYDSTYNATTKNILYLRFVTDGSSTGQGFKIHFSTGCGGVLKGRRGFFATPNYPLQYPINQDCRWSFQIHPHFTVQITDLNINLPPRDSKGQCTDRIEGRAGTSINETLIIALCDKHDLPIYDTKSNEVFLRFLSDGIDNGAQYNGVSARYRAVCGEHIKNSLNGTIDMKPNLGYFNNETCEWLIEFPAGKKISLETTSFLLESEYPVCPYDYLEIRDGKNSLAPLIGKWCGNFKPPHIQSSSNFLFIKFKTDETVISDGFSIKYSDESLDCGGDLNITNNQMESPNYPQPLLPNAACGWRLTVPDGQRINITFTLMALFRRGTSCTERLIIYDSDYPDERYRRTNGICGSSIPNSIVTSSNKAYVTFITSTTILPSATPRGFKAFFEPITPVCGGVLNATAEEKSLSITGLPDGTNCEWVIIGPKGQKVSIKFTEFNVGKLIDNAYCTSGVIVRDKLTINGTVYCGSDPPNAFHGSYETMAIRLNNSLTTNKVTIKYAAREDCDKNYTEPSGVVTSLNYPRDYPHHMDCALLISAPTGKIITLYSATFNIEKPTSGPCIYEKVDIYDGNSLTSTRFNNETLCGQLQLPTMQSTGNSLFIRFKTDYSVSHSGFAFSYTTNSPGACGGLISGFTGAITTPNYPQYYGDHLNCEWNITVAVGKKIRLSVPDFQSEGASDCSNADGLEIFDGMTSSWGMFCGSAVPAPRVSSSNQIRVTFKSNSVHNDFRGFKLQFDEVA